MKDYRQSNYKSDNGHLSIWLALGAYTFIGCVVFYGLWTF